MSPKGTCGKARDSCSPDMLKLESVPVSISRRTSGLRPRCAGEKRHIAVNCDKRRHGEHESHVVLGRQMPESVCRTIPFTQGSERGEINAGR